MNMDWPKTALRLLLDALKYTFYGLLFGAALEYLLSLSGRPYRVSTPLLIGALVFTLSVIGSTVAMFAYWWTDRWNSRNPR